MRSAYRAALEEWTRDRVPLDWAEAQSNLGTVLRVVGKIEKDEAALNGAIDAFNAALGEWTQDRTPFDWAMANNNLGNALTDLGIMRNDRAMVEEGIAAYERALLEWKRDRVPLLWAATQNNIGATYATLGRGLDPDEALDAFWRAVEAYEMCLEERTQQNDAWDWAGTNYNLATVLVDIADRTEGVAELERAVDAYQATLAVYDQSSSPENVADVQDRMGWAKGLLGFRSRDPALLAEARAHLEASYDYFRGQDGARRYFEERLHQIDEWLEAVS